MDQTKDYLKDITEIRSMMERSSRFISLSGLSGVFAGVFAIAGVAAVYFQLHLEDYDHYYEAAYNTDTSDTTYNNKFLWFCIIDAAIVLIASLSCGIFFTTRKAKQQGLKIWDKSAQQLLINLSIPLFAGGILCLILFNHQLIGLIAPVTLIFYGLALLNGGKYTVNEIRYLGILEIILGLVSAYFIGYGLLLWTIGFGLLHIIYGGIMYFKYER
jgi:uncharacterized membrane protein YgdD (TMEM256/DUF423 family)